jgi:hypothetical protein
MRWQQQQMLAWQQHQQQQMAVAVCYQQQQQQQQQQQLQQLARYQQQALAAQAQAYAHAHAMHARPAQLHLGLPSLRQRTHQHGVQSSASGRHLPTGPSPPHTTAVWADVGGLAAGAGAAAAATDSGARGVRGQPGAADATPAQRAGGEIEDEMMEEALRAMAAAGGGEARILTRVRLAEVPIPRVWRRLVGEIIDIVVVNIMALLCLGGQRFDELFFADDAPLLALLWAAEVRHWLPLPSPRPQQARGRLFALDACLFDPSPPPPNRRHKKKSRRPITF